MVFILLEFRELEELGVRRVPEGLSVLSLNKKRDFKVIVQQDLVEL
jgi:hypothetical protein